MILSEEDVQHLEMKIAAAEQLTSAEFKIIVARRAWFGTRKKAIKLFKKYKLDKTQSRNAVLLLVLEKDKQLLIYGDEGIHNKVGTGRWELIRDEVLAEFRKGEYAVGLGLGIHLVADSLIEHFPLEAHRVNEVSNEIIFEK